MTLVSDDLSYWTSINSYRVISYFVVAAAVVVMYDWGEHYDKESLISYMNKFDLRQRQRWSLMTVLYLIVRYLGMLYVIVPTILLTDAVSLIVYVIWNWTSAVVNPMLGVIMITRLHAMYQRSRKILIFLIVTFLAVIIFSGAVAVMIAMHTSGEEIILSGTYQCTIGYGRDTPLLGAIAWIVGTVWEVFALCLAVWVAVKHFSELRQHSAGGIIGDCFTVLMKTHMFYFASFVVVSCCRLISFLSSTNLFVQSSPGIQMYEGFGEIFPAVQMFVLGPRLILGIREYHAKLVADSDAATNMASIAFQERVHILTGNGV
ncbi:hypothetical protein BDR03DRAFT_974931 [Suillus americanus]|nr:hypothetical protein BDR03DRAFT_974931 [Suillus americanus]